MLEICTSGSAGGRAAARPDAASSSGYPMVRQGKPGLEGRSKRWSPEIEESSPAGQSPSGESRAGTPVASLARRPGNRRGEA